MAERDQVYKCERCGNLINVVHGGAGKMVCCGEEMKLLEPNTVDAAQEKHVPVIDKTGNTVKVAVGGVAHPMEAEHYIETISVLTDKRLYRAYLSPGDKPEAVFVIDEDVTSARAYCNIHGLWKSN